MGLPSLNPSACIGKPVSIYLLVDPRDQTAFYVGATTKPVRQRLSSHINDACHLAARGARYERIRDIAAAGARADACVLETARAEDWVEAEQFWIAYFRAIGARLTNVAIGGPGALGTRQKPTTKIRRQEAAAGRDMSAIRTPVVREKAARKLRHTIIADGVEYDGIAVAARALGISHSLVHRRVDLSIYQRVTPRKNDNVVTLRGRPTGARNHQSKPVTIDGIGYASMREARQALGISRERIRKLTRAN